jgi:drug/metabolite transporter (DMT)-like permease
MQTKNHPPAWKILSAFAIIYLVWGSTFLAIRIGVHEVPPFLFAAMRFSVAGLVLYGWMSARGEPSPNRRQWMSILLLALLIFVFDYGLLFWAEQRVPSGIAAVMMATIPSSWRYRRSSSSEHKNSPPASPWRSSSALEELPS